MTWTNMCGKSCATCEKTIYVCHTPAGYYLGKEAYCRATPYMSKDDAEKLALSIINKKGA